ncbi:protein D3 isoform X2 [Bemisia tabaci]|nr:PREDICTED: protein D3-like isoform X2 [Bemisia tabaci]
MISGLRTANVWLARLRIQLSAHIIYCSLMSIKSIRTIHTTQTVTPESELITPHLSWYKGRNQKQIEHIFKKHEIIPDLLDEAPQYEFKFRWVGQIWPDFGTKHHPEELKFTPFAFKFPAIPNVLYSFFMFDLDSPSRKNATKRSYIHWGLANMLKYNILLCETLAKYVGPFPEKGTGPHRYVFLIYKQPFSPHANFTVHYTEPRMPQPDRDDPQRANWDLRKIVKKYKLEGPVAGNFLYSEWAPPLEEYP